MFVFLCLCDLLLEVLISTASFLVSLFGASSCEALHGFMHALYPYTSIKMTICQEPADKCHILE